VMFYSAVWLDVQFTQRQLHRQPPSLLQGE
jgi:hypothetical protein